MSAPREPNPLRPYYIPPSVGDATGAYAKSSTSPNLSRQNGPSQQAPSSSFGSSARNILADMDYSDYLSDASPSTTASIKSLADQALLKYSSVFLAQPFEVAKTVLQVRLARAEQRDSSQDASADEARRRRISNRSDNPQRLYDVCPPSTRGVYGCRLTILEAIFRFGLRLALLLHSYCAPPQYAVPPVPSSKKTRLNRP